MVQLVPKPSPTRPLITFGPFKLAVAERSLVKDSDPVRIGGRALDILIALVERPGEIVSQQDLLTQVWAGVTVAESGLRVHINALRRALGDGRDGARFITNVAGRGYCFVAPVTCGPPAAKAGVTSGSRSPKPIPPPRSGRLFGRKRVVRLIADDLLVHRFMTIVGAGGIGKTTVALGVGHELMTAFDGNIAFADLSMIGDTELVLPTIRAALNLPPGPDPMAGLLDALCQDQLLLILDCCEHVVDAVAALAERMFQASQKCFLLATSREPLRVDGERLFHLSALPCPPIRLGLTASEALRYPAVQLLVEKVSAIQHGFVLLDEDADIVAGICRRVDGIALAIELVAGRVGAYGLREVAAMLEGRIQLLWQGRRTAPPRQQTLNATLDWSYQLLNDAGRGLLCRLSVFAGPFTLNAARAVAVDDDCDDDKVVEVLASLVDKSLVTADLTGSTPSYRLLDVTREFARAQASLAEASHALSLRHARYYDGLFDSVAEQGAGSDLASSIIMNIRAALQWCFSNQGDRELGVSLASRSAQAFLDKGLVSEAKFWTESALRHLDETLLGSHEELRLQTALYTALQFGVPEEREAAFARSLAIARSLDEQRQQITLLYFHLTEQIIVGDQEEALVSGLETNNTFGKRGDPIQSFAADAILVGQYKYLGKDNLALEHALLADSCLKRMSPELREQVDKRLVARFKASEAVLKFLCGYPDQAGEVARSLTESMRESENFINWCNLFGSIAFVFKWRSEWDVVKQICEVYKLRFSDQPISTQSLLFGVLEADMQIACGRPLEGVRFLTRELAHLDPQSPLRLIAYAPLARGLMSLERYADALSVIDIALDEETKLNGSGYRAEFLLLQGEALQSLPAPDLAAAERALRLSLEAAKRQASLSRELDAATALAILLEQLGRIPEAFDILSPVYERFTEGFSTPDLKTAKALLDRFQPTPIHNLNWTKSRNQVEKPGSGAFPNRFLSTALSLVICVLFALTGAPTAVLAATFDLTNEQFNLETIVVTARRRAELLDQTPIAISAFNQADLERRQIHSLADLAQYVPSLNAYAVQSDMNSFYSAEPRLRGLPGTVVYFADVPFADADYNATTGLQHGFSEGNLYDLADVEVVKGPQGTLFGKNSIGGLIAYQPRRPTNRFGGYVRLSLGNYRDREADFAVNLPLVRDSLSLRVAGQAQRREGYTHELTQNIRLDDKNFRAFRVGVLFTPSPSFENYLLYDDYRQNSNGSSVVVSDLSPNSFVNYLYPHLAQDFALQKRLGVRSVVGDNYQHIGKDHFSGITNVTTWRPRDDFTIKNIAALRVTKQLPTNDDVLLGARNPLLFIGAPGTNTQLANDSSQYTDELQVQGHAHKLQWQVGAFFEQIKPNSDTLIASGALVNTPFGGFSYYHFDVRTRSTAVFAHVEYDADELVKGLKIAGGYRYTWDRNKTAALGVTGTDAVTRDGAGRATNCTGLFLTDNDCFQRAPTANFRSGGWNLSATEQISQRLMVYLRAGNAYRPGGINLNVPAQYAAFGPEHVTDIELGLKADWTLLGMSGRIAGDIFRTYYKDIRVKGVVSVLDPQGKTRVNALTLNAARAKLNGAELETTIRPIAGVELNGHASYLRSRYDEYPAALSPAGNKTPFLYSPKWSYGADAAIHLPLRAALGDISLFANYSWYGAQYTSTNPLEPSAKLPPHRLVNLRFDWNNVGSRPYDISLWVNNALDTTYATGSIPLYSVLGFTSLSYNSPRMAGVTVKWRFGDR